MNVAAYYSTVRGEQQKSHFMLEMIRGGIWNEKYPVCAFTCIISEDIFEFFCIRNEIQCFITFLMRNKKINEFFRRKLLLYINKFKRNFDLMFKENI